MSRSQIASGHRPVKTIGGARRTAAAAATGFSLLAAFQLSLAFGAPLGHLAWGGAQERLPSGLRIASAFAAVVFVVAALTVLGRAGYRMSPVAPRVSRSGIWVLVFGLAVSALGNFASSSNWERFLLGPIALLEALLCLIVARSGGGSEPPAADEKTSQLRSIVKKEKVMFVTSSTVYLTRPGGRIGYDVSGEGPLVILVPGMGDLRTAYRFLAPALREAGFRVACTDLRGHGASDATFASYGDVETAGDVIALIEELKEPAVVVGNSMGAGAAAFAAAQRPDLVRGLVLVGPFVRNPKVGAFQRIVLRVAMARPWAAVTWNAYLPKLYAGRRPADFDEYRALLVASVRRPGYAKSFSLTTRTDHAPVAALLGQVAAPTLVVMGEQDPDFKDQRAEAEWIAQALNGEVVMVPQAGHYPQSQRPDITTEAILRFLRAVNYGDVVASPTSVLSAAGSKRATVGS